MLQASRLGFSCAGRNESHENEKDTENYSCYGDRQQRIVPDIIEPYIIRVCNHCCL